MPITDPDLFRWKRAILGSMKQCPVCGREVVSKRKDAVFCKDSACRKKAHQGRQAQAAKLPPPVNGNKAAVVVTFPDGSRWLLELTPLQATAQAELPSLTQVAATIAWISSGSDPSASAVLSPSTAAPLAVISIAESSSDQIPRAVIQQEDAQPATDPASLTTTPADIQRTADALGTRVTAAESEEQSVFRTIELFFTDESGRRVPFQDAVQRRTIGGWRVRRHAKAQLGLSRHDGYGLGGTPGKWHDYYPHQAPSECGFDRDFAVLYADTDANQTCVADSELLREALGVEWRERLRQVVGDYWRASNRRSVQ